MEHAHVLRRHSSPRNPWHPTLTDSAGSLSIVGRCSQRPRHSAHVGFLCLRRDRSRAILVKTPRQGGDELLGGHMGFIEGLLGKKRDEDFDWLDLKSPILPHWDLVCTEDEMDYEVDRTSCFKDGDIVWWRLKRPRFSESFRSRGSG